MTVSRWNLLTMRNVSGKCVEKLKTHICYSVTFFFRKSCRLSDNVEKHGRTRRATYDSILRRMHVACWITKATDTHLEYILCYLLFSTAVMVTLTRVNVTYTYIAYIFCLIISNALKRKEKMQARLVPSRPISRCFIYWVILETWTETCTRYLIYTVYYCFSILINVGMCDQILLTTSTKFHEYQLLHVDRRTRVTKSVGAFLKLLASKMPTADSHILPLHLTFIFPGYCW
jgi:hypothetical protein